MFREVRDKIWVLQHPWNIYSYVGERIIHTTDIRICLHFRRRRIDWQNIVVVFPFEGIFDLVFRWQSLLPCQKSSKEHPRHSLTFLRSSSIGASTLLKCIDSIVKRPVCVSMRSTHLLSTFANDVNNQVKRGDDFTLFCFETICIRFKWNESSTVGTSRHMIVFWRVCSILLVFPIESQDCL